MNIEQPAQPMHPDQVLGILNAEVAKYARSGWIVQSQVGNQAVLSRNKKIGWFWNTILSLITFGIWLIVIIYRVVNRKKYTKIITVDPMTGRIQIS